MLISSLSSVLGGLGFTAYAAANLFMDAFVQRHNQANPVPWVSVNWDAWHLTEAQQREVAAEERLAEFALTPEEGVAAFQRILTMGPAAQVVVSTGDLQARISQWVDREALQEGKPAAQGEPSAVYPRPNLPNPYVAPRNEVEQTIATIWQETLGIQQVGIHDNFFDLGGNSLTGIQVIARLKQVFQMQIPTVSLYEGPSVSALAKMLSQEQPEPPVYDQSRSRGERRREKRRERRG